MRILYIDIDSLRPDHLGCYGYHRATSPNIDRIAAQGMRMDRCFASDVPCLPSRTAMFGGRFGIHSGVVNHSGSRADVFNEGARRGFRNQWNADCWMTRLREAGYYTATVSSFGDRHSAWQWYAGFNEVHSHNGRGHERADDIEPTAMDFLDRRGREDRWFLHVNFWDVHTPYRTPDAYGDPFKDEPLPDWLTEDVRQQHWRGCGLRSAQDAYDFMPMGEHPRMHRVMQSMDDVRTMFDGYDTAIRYVDDAIGRLCAKLDALGVLDETAIIITADHGENLGERNAYASHRTADMATGRVPMIIRWPGIAPGASDALRYHVDVAATVVELAGGSLTDNWDGRSFAAGLQRGDIPSHGHLVIGQCAQAIQRSVVFRAQDTTWLCLRTWHCGFGGFPPVMLFDLDHDPHEQHDVADARPEIVAAAMARYDQWLGEMMRTASHPADPMWQALHELPEPCRTLLPRYIERLHHTGRSRWAEHLARRYPEQAKAAD